MMENGRKKGHCRQLVNLTKNVATFLRRLLFSPSAHIAPGIFLVVAPLVLPVV